MIFAAASDFFFNCKHPGVSCEDVENAKEVGSTSQGARRDRSSQVHYHELQGITCVVVESNSRVRGAGQLP